jgi:hypothetical protein
MQKIKISLPEPCHENWNNMTASSQGRFCNTCAKSVIDFSSMTDAEVLNYFSLVKDDNICGRVSPDQLERTIQTPAGKNKGWYWNYIVAFFFLFTKGNNAKAQGEVKTCHTQPPAPGKKNSPGTQTTKPVKNEVQVRLGKIYMGHPPGPGKTSGGVTSTPGNSHLPVTGKIMDENGQPIPSASIIVLPAGTGLPAAEDGTFYVNPYPLKSSLKISAIGYEEKIIDRLDTLPLTIILKQSATKLGEVVVTGRESRLAGGLSIVRTRTLMDTVKHFISRANPTISMYPNPVRAGSTLTVELKLKPGVYNLQMLDAAGRVITQQQINATARTFREKLEIEKSRTGGNYFIRVFDGKNKMVEGAGFVIL